MTDRRDRCLAAFRVGLVVIALGCLGLVNDAHMNADIVSLDHNAVGILRYDEDSWKPIFLVLVTTIRL